MFYIYDLILIRQASFGNHVQVKDGYWAKATRELSQLSAKDLQRAAQEFTEKKKMSNSAIHSLITNMRLISSFNPESFGEKMRFRNLLFGKIGRLGLPLIWFTLNPKEIGNILVVKLSGEEISLDEPGLRSKLLQLTIKNPSLVAQFFHVVITSFFSCFFKTLSKEPGTFGTVSSHFGIVESTTRMMLHLHGFAWLAGNIGAADLHQRLKSDTDFKNRVLVYIRSIVRGTVDLTLGQQFQSETPGLARFPIPEDMTSAEFQEALEIDSNNVAARVQMHTHSQICTKYQKRVPRLRRRPHYASAAQSKEATTDATGSSQHSASSEQHSTQYCRFLFPKPLVLESLVTEDGYIKMTRNNSYVNKYNPVIASATGYSHDINFTASSPKVLAAIYYMTNYATKAQIDRGQLVLAAAMLKKAQETAEAEAAKNINLPAPVPLDMSKFALKAYNRFTRDVEVGAPAVAHFLLGQPSAYIPNNDSSVTINFYWIKTNVRRILNSLFDTTSNEFVEESSNQYVNFDGRTRRASIYENYEHRGIRLAHLCFYEYASQIFSQTLKGAKNRVLVFPFAASHPQHMTHVQVSVGSVKSLKTPSLCGSFTSTSEQDTDTLDTTLWTADQVYEVLLGLFYPWDQLKNLRQSHIESLRSALYKNTMLWTFLVSSIPSYLVQLSQNVLLLRRSKEAADQDRKERGLEFDDYFDSIDQDLYNENEEVNVDMDFELLQPTDLNLLQAALGFPGVSMDSLSSLRYSRNPILAGVQFTSASLVKIWEKELKAFKDQDQVDKNNCEIDINGSTRDAGDLDAALVPVLGFSTDSIQSLQYLQAAFQADPSVEKLLALVATQYPLNKKQRLVIRALIQRVLYPVQISSVHDQFLLYLGGIGGVGKTHLIKAFIFGLSILLKQNDVLLTASTGAAAANINGATYHSALGFGTNGNQPLRQATKSRLYYKRIFILDEISMVSLENLVQINNRCNAIWDLNRTFNTVFGGLPIVILLGDFNQFAPVRGHAIWSQVGIDSDILDAGRTIWRRFTSVVFLTEQMRQAEDVPFQGLLQRARSSTLTANDVDILNLCTTENRLANGEIPPERAIIRLNRIREKTNLEHLQAFAKAHNQRIYLFPARHDIPTGTNIDQLTLIQQVYHVGEIGYLKGPGLLAFTKGMPVMLQQNTNTFAGLVNGMRATGEEVVLDTNTQGIVAV